MIQGIWGNVRIFCGCHGDNKNVELVPHDPSQSAIWSGGSNSIFYSCPKYYSDNRDETEKACFNRLNLVEYEEMVREVSNRLEGDGGIGEKIYLDGMKWKNKKGTEFEVIRQDDTHIDVSVINHRALRN